MRSLVLLILWALAAPGGVMSAAGPPPTRDTFASIEAETAVLGGMLIDREAVTRAVEVLNESMFYREANRRLFRAASRLFERGDVVDVITLSEELKKTGELDSAGGFDYLAALLDAVPTAANLEYHANIVRAFAQRRQMRAALQAGLRDLEGTDIGLPEFIEAHRAKIDVIGREQDSGDGFRIYTERELAEIPAPDELLESILVKGGLGVLYGPPEVGKTFLALDWALCIRDGISWIGRATQRGQVVYISAEGAGGLRGRIAAWEDFQQLPAPGSGLFTIPEPVHMADALEVGRFLRTLKAQLPDAPALVVIDTLARCIAGSDENDTSDMGRFVEGCDRVRREFSSSVLILHHPNAGGDRERGNTSLRGAADTVAKLTAEGSIRVLKCEKAKDMAHFEPITLRLKPHAGSAIVTPTRSPGVTGVNVSEGALQTLQFLQGAALEEGLSSTAWLKVSNLTESTFYTHRKALVDNGLVERDGIGKGSLYRVSEAGRKAIEGLLQ